MRDRATKRLVSLYADPHVRRSCGIAVTAPMVSLVESVELKAQLVRAGVLAHISTLTGEHFRPHIVRIVDCKRLRFAPSAHFVSVDAVRVGGALVRRDKSDLHVAAGAFLF